MRRILPLNPPLLIKEGEEKEGKKNPPQSTLIKEKKGEPKRGAAPLPRTSPSP